MKIIFTLCILVAICFAAVETGYIWHITDTHFQPTYVDGGEVDKEHCNKVVEGATNTGGPYGHYHCDTPRETLESAWEQIRNLDKYTEGKAPEFIFWTGDHTSSYDSRMSEDDTRRFIENITLYLRELQKALPETKIFPILGNHDSYPAGEFPAEGPFFVYDYVADMWGDFVSKESQETLRKGMFYTEVLKPGLRLIALNTAAYYKYNKMIDSELVDPAGQMTWLKETLELARKNEERVMIMSHICPGKNELGFSTEMYQGFSDQIVLALSGYHDIIVAGFFGHNHNNGFRLIYDADNVNEHKKNGKGSVHFIGSSVAGRSAVNPMITLFKFDSKAPFTIRDRTVYYVDLPTVNPARKISWDTSFSMSEYGLTDLTAPSIETLLGKLETNNTLFRTFHDRLQVNSSEKTWFPVCDTPDCVKQTMCFIRNALYNAADNCAASSQ